MIDPFVVEAALLHCRDGEQGSPVVECEKFRTSGLTAPCEVRILSHMSLQRKRKEADGLTRRERQLMDVVLRLGKASAREIWAELKDQPSYSTVRKLLSVLEAKGHLTHRLDGKKYVYFSRRPRAKMAEAALRRLRDTFFGGSTEQVVSGLLRVADSNLTEDELARIADLIERAKREDSSS